MMAGGIGSDALGGTTSFLDLQAASAGVAAVGNSMGGNNIAPNSMTAPHVGNPDIMDGLNAEEQGNRMQAYDTQEGKDFRVGEIYREGESQREKARSPEQQLGNYAYYNWNLAQNNPRGNLNKRSYATTLRMQRLADMVNNRLHYDPGTASTIGGAQGAKSVGQGTATVESWDPMETQEMRQMRANERVDENARNAGVDLQSRIQGYSQDIQEKMDEDARKLRYYINQMDDDFISWFQKTVIETEYRGSWTTYFNQKMQEYINELGLDTKSRLYEIVSQLSPAIAQQWGQVFLGGYIATPTAQWYLESMIGMISRADIPDEAKAVLIGALQSAIGAIVARGESIAAGKVVNPFGDGLGGKTPDTLQEYRERYGKERSKFRIK